MIEQLPPPPEGSPFALQKVEDIFLPHPYVIGPKHVAMAAGGFLGKEAIEASERVGYGCQHSGCRVPYTKHNTSKTLFVLLDSKPPRNLWEVPGLQAYLLSIKEKAEYLGIQGFAFPHRK